MLTITQVGLSAITNAAAGGFKVNIASFKLSEYNLSGTASTDLLNATSMFGTAVFEDLISLTEVVSSSTVRLTLVVPKALPNTGSWFFREIGIYLDTGELFAIGALDPAYEKDNGYSIKIYVLATANRLADVVSVTVNQNNSLPMVAQVRQLPDPSTSEHSVIAVLDEISCLYADSYAAGLAVKSGPGLLHWSFIGHNRVYYGIPDSVSVGGNQFIVHSATGGFWLNDGEYILAQVVSGAGAGQCRRMKYGKLLEQFTSVDVAFANLDTTSVLAIWRDNSNQLPSRDSSIPSYMVLGHGLRSWHRVDAQPTTFVSYTALSVSSTLNSDSQFAHTIIQPETSDRLTYVWVEGKLIPQSQYSLSPNIITVYGKPNGAKIDIMLLKQVPSAIGGVLNAFEARMTGDGSTIRFYFSMIPKSHDWIAVYIDGQYQHQSQYSYDTTNITFNTAPAIGADVLIVQFATYDDPEGTCNAIRTFRQIYPGTSIISIADPFTSQNQLMISVDGVPLEHKNYQLVSTGIQILSPPAFPGGSSYVDITMFIPTVAINTLYVPASFSGTDTGPVWIDPAGLEGPPDRLIPKTKSFVSDGAQTTIHGWVVTDRNYTLLFHNGQYINSSTYTYNNGTITLATPFPSGDFVDVIFFTENSSQEGFEVVCTTFNVTSDGNMSYQLPLLPDGNVDNIIVCVNQVYQHKLTYTVDPNNMIYFQTLGANKSIEVWFFQNTSHTGWRTTMKVDSLLSAGANNYPLSQTVTRRENVLAFVDTNKRDDSQYLTSTYNDHITLNPNAAVNAAVTFVSFVSSVPRSRLLTRTEYNQSIVSFNYRTGTVLLTREDVAAVLHREDILATFNSAELAILEGTVTPPPSITHAQPGNTFAITQWTVPAGVYHINAIIIGAGGQGGGGSNTQGMAGHGGKRGQCIVMGIDVVPGQQINIELGIGGSSYLYRSDGTIIYPQIGDPGTSNGNTAWSGRDGGATIFDVYSAAGGQGGGTDPIFVAPYQQVDAEGEGQFDFTTGTGSYLGGGPAGVAGEQTPGNNTMMFSDGTPNAGLGNSMAQATGGGYPATAPGAGGGGSAADPNGIGTFGGPGMNGVVYISW